MQCDARAMVVMTLCLSAATYLADQNMTLGGLAILLLVIGSATNTPFKQYARNVGLMAWLAGATFLIPVWHQADAGVSEGFRAVARLFTVVGWVTVLSAAASALELVYSLERLGQPLQKLGVPMHVFAVVAMLSMRFIPIFFQETHALLEAYHARGLDAPTASRRSRLRQLTMLGAPLLHSLLRRAEHLAAAMESRAFHAARARSNLHDGTLMRRDYLVMSMSAGVLLLVWLFE